MYENVISLYNNVVCPLLSSVPEEESDVNDKAAVLAMLQMMCNEEITMTTTTESDGTIQLHLLTHDASSDATSQPDDLLMLHGNGQSDATRPHSSLSPPSSSTLGTVQTHPSGQWDILQPDPGVLPSASTQAFSNQPLPNNLADATQPDSAQLAPRDPSNGKESGASSTDGAGASRESYAGMYMCEMCACVFRFPRELLAHYASENHHPSYF